MHGLCSARSRHRPQSQTYSITLARPFSKQKPWLPISYSCWITVPKWNKSSGTLTMTIVSISRQLLLRKRMLSLDQVATDFLTTTVTVFTKQEAHITWYRLGVTWSQTLVFVFRKPEAKGLTNGQLAELL